MLYMFSLLSLSFIIALLLIIIMTLISLRSLKDREKISPFECGFDPITYARLPFSMRFFLLAVIFIVFDIELVLLMPLIFTSTATTLWIPLMMFLLILLLGLLHEWHEGSLDWTK